jgi:hypothetical protein
MILNWCQSGKELNSDEITGHISECKSIEELLTLCKMFPQYQKLLRQEFEKQK